ncbi:hypothetical protein GIB67_013446 [Kingdonia uniflora]|uniref:Carbohydrate kinase PfkB domain-containing protein n=1 Tax=Kingdonia uniflora TaxID=39325 RepID=A0A7J7LR23_9MAGN|nr:hypothetical protein GIB67_013446 [Kingdonia uniflora]
MAPVNSNLHDLIVSFGDMLINFVPTVSGVALAESPGFVKVPGGTPTNVVIVVARLGGKAAFVGKLDDDEFGRMLANILKDNGVITDGILFDEGARTVLAFVTLKSDGDREFMFCRNPSADMLLTKAEFNLDLIRKAKIFHYGSISLIMKPCRSAHIKAMEVNDNELEFLTGCEVVNDEAALSLWHPRLKFLLVILGEKGCSYYIKDFCGSVDPFVVKTVDMTGAGDAFVGALLTKIVNDGSIESILKDEARLREVLKFTNGCGAITTTKKGVIPVLPNETEVLKLIQVE